MWSWATSRRRRWRTGSPRWQLSFTFLVTGAQSHRGDLKKVVLSFLMFHTKQDLSYIFKSWHRDWSIFAIFDEKPPFCLIWTLFGQSLGTFPIRPVSMIPWLLNRIIFWIESAKNFLNWIILWIESGVKQYWIKYWMNHFLAKFKNWIESDWVSFTTTNNANDI